MNHATNVSRESIILDIEYMLHRFDTKLLLRVLWYVRRIW